MRRLVIIPGIFKRERFLADIRQQFGRHRVDGIINPIPWLSKRHSFQSVLNELVGRINRLAADGQRISLIGTSAGGSLAVNLLSLLPDKIGKVVCICSPLQDSPSTFISIGKRLSPIFSQSLEHCHRNLAGLNSEVKARILLVRPRFDELVPGATMAVEGIEIAEIQGGEHLINISRAMTIYSEKIFRHLEFEKT